MPIQKNSGNLLYAPRSSFLYVYMFKNKAEGQYPNYGNKPLWSQYPNPLKIFQKTSIPKHKKNLLKSIIFMTNFFD